MSGQVPVTRSCSAIRVSRGQLLPLRDKYLSRGGVPVTCPCSTGAISLLSSPCRGPGHFRSKSKRQPWLKCALHSNLYSPLWPEQAATCKNAEKSPDLKKEISPASEAPLLCKGSRYAACIGKAGWYTHTPPGRGHSWTVGHMRCQAPVLRAACKVGQKHKRGISCCDSRG